MVGIWVQENYKNARTWWRQSIENEKNVVKDVYHCCFIIYDGEHLCCIVNLP